MRKAVKLPEGEDLNEWLAVNGKLNHLELHPDVGGAEHDTRTLIEYPTLSCKTTVADFYTQVNLLYGSITEFCSPQSCPEMKATDE